MHLKIDSTWDFKSENTKEYTHCFHNYPAMMIPQVARRLIKEFGAGAKVLFDPYCGTGTSLVEANLNNINAIGTDINPLACLVTKAKTTPLNVQSLNLYLKDFNSYTFQYKYGIRDFSSIILPNFKNIDFWFSKDVQAELAVIRQYIDNISDEDIKNFFKVAFSETVRESSWTKNSEFKLVRMDKEKIDKFEPDVFGLMESKLIRNKIGLEAFSNAVNTKYFSHIYELDTTKPISNKIIYDKCAHIVITSPPYGDSRTTVAYGQFSRLSSQWMGYYGANNLDNLMMGGKSNGEDIDSESTALSKTIRKLEMVDERRSKEVKSFFIDYKKSIDNVSKKIRRGGYACYVVGNRTVKGLQIPTSTITKDFFEENGFTHMTTIIRNIPNKRMPSENSPSNIRGEKSPTMKNEYIFVCKKL